jgi:hypothetical protein
MPCRSPFLTSLCVCARVGPAYSPNSLLMDRAPRLPGSIRVRRTWTKNKLPPDLRSAIKIDQRFLIGRELLKFRTDLVEQFGGPGSLTPFQRQSLELICQLKARLLAMDKQFADAGGTADDLSPFLAKSYLSFSNSLARQLRDLQMQVAATNKAKAGPPSLQDRLALIQGGKKATSG